MNKLVDPDFLGGRGEFVILDPGDAIYIPQGYWHMAQGLGINFGVNHWLMPTDYPEFDTLRLCPEDSVTPVSLTGL